MTRKRHMTNQPSTTAFELGNGAEILLATAHLDLMAIDEQVIPELHRIAMIPAVRRGWRTRGTYVAQRTGPTCSSAETCSSATRGTAPAAA